MRTILKQKMEFFIRSLDAGTYLETFFISAISSLLLLRAYLKLAGYPAVGGGGIHIAHMLWGGLFMMAALLVLLIFLNKEAKQVSSVLGGVGFGIFIDELGKFITRDNNYFFQPTIALIYVIFVLIFLSIRWLERFFPITPKVYAVNSLELAKEAVMEDLDEQEHKKLVEYVRLSDPKNPFNADLLDIVNKLKQHEDLSPGVWLKTRLWMKRLYEIFVKKKGFARSIIAVSVLYLFVALLLAVWNLGGKIIFSTVGELAATLTASYFALKGIRHILARRRLEAYEDLKTSVTISIFLTQFFLYLNQQLWGSVALVFNLMAFAVLKYLIDQETVRNNKDGLE